MLNKCESQFSALNLGCVYIKQLDLSFEWNDWSEIVMSVDKPWERISNWGNQESISQLQTTIFMTEHKSTLLLYKTKLPTGHIVATIPLSCNILSVWNFKPHVLLYNSLTPLDFHRSRNDWSGEKHGVSVNRPDFSQVLYTLEMSGIL